MEHVRFDAEIGIIYYWNLWSGELWWWPVEVQLGPDEWIYEDNFSGMCDLSCWLSFQEEQSLRKKKLERLRYWKRKLFQFWVIESLAQLFSWRLIPGRTQYGLANTALHSLFFSVHPIFYQVSQNVDHMCVLIALKSVVVKLNAAENGFLQNLFSSRENWGVFLLRLYFWSSNK